MECLFCIEPPINGEITFDNPALAYLAGYSSGHKVGPSINDSQSASIRITRGGELIFSLDPRYKDKITVNGLSGKNNALGFDTAPPFTHLTVYRDNRGEYSLTPVPPLFYVPDWN